MNYLRSLGLVLSFLALFSRGNALETAPSATTEFASIADAIAVAQSSDFGQGGPAMEYVRARVMEVQLDPPARSDLANALASSLDDEASTYTYKIFVCRQLYIIGSEEQVDELAPLLKDPRLAYAARCALEVIPGGIVNDLLWEAIPSSDATVAVGLVSSLAARGGASTVMRLGQLLSSHHPEIVTASIVGLGRIGGQEAERILRGTFSTLPETLQTEYYEAMLACAEQYSAADRPLDAARLYQDLQQPVVPLAVRLAAFNGQILLQGEVASPLVAQALLSSDTPWVKVALNQVRTMGGPSSTVLFAQQLGLLAPDLQVQLINALADRGDAAALPAVSSGLNSASPAVQYAAIEALGRIGNETSVSLLLSGLASADEEIAKRSRHSLARIPDAGVNGALIQAYERGEEGIRSALAPVLAERQASDALPALYAVAAHQSGEARSTAIKAIGQIAREGDLDQVLDLYYGADDEEVRIAAAEAITTLCRHAAPSEARSTSRASIYTLAPTSLTRATALDIFRKLGDNVLLPLVISACEDPDSVVREAGITALSGWPNPTPLQEVYALAKGADTEVQRALALDGYIRMLRLPSDQSEIDKLAGFKAAIELASGRPDTVRAVLAGLSDLKSAEALDVAEGYLTDTELHPEAAVAAEKIRRHSYTVTTSINSATAANALDGNIDSFWSTGVPQVEGQWIELDMSRPASIKGLVLDASRTKNAYPRSYAVQVFAKGADAGAPITIGAGSEGVTEISFPTAVTGQNVRITQTGNDPESFWAVHELRVIPE